MLVLTSAYTLGARVIEKHFTLDKNLPGPDHKASSSPEEFKELVNSIRLAEISMGDPIKKVQKEEEQMRERGQIKKKHGPRWHKGRGANHFQGGAAQ